MPDQSLLNKSKFKQGMISTKINDFAGDDQNLKQFDAKMENRGKKETLFQFLN